jgi:hypothetical protein
MIHTETVHPSQLRRAMAAYAAQGYPPHYGPHPSQPGMMVIVIAVPEDAPVPNWQYAPPRPRRWFRPDWRRIVVAVCILVMAGSLAYIAYGMFAGAAPQQATPEPSLWDRIADVVPHGEPVVEHAAPAIEMPWDAAGRQVGEVMDGIGRILTGLFALLVLGVIAFVAFKVRGALHR